MAKSDREFVIPFVGLKIGIHTFEFEVTDAFFERVEYALIEKGNVHVTLNLEKKETMMIGTFTIDGKVETTCDVCTEPVTVPVKGEYRLIYKFDNEPSDDESLIVVYPEEFELNLRENILELITVSLPSRNIHPKGECNEEMITILNQYRVNSEDEEDYFDEDDFDDEDFDDDESDDEEDNEEEDDDDDDPDDDSPIDPRWSALKNLN